MEQSFFDESALRDPTWKRALTIVKQELAIPSNVWTLIRNGWTGALNITEFVHHLGFCRFNLHSLILAANIQREGDEPEIDVLRRAIMNLGIPMSTVILTINMVCQRVLATKPPTVWRPIFEQMMACIEIGTKLGGRTSMIDSTGGALIGFSRGAGLAILMAHDGAAFRKWYGLTNGVESRELLVQMFGCESYQVAAFALQQLGFGTEIAVGAAIATNQMQVGSTSFGPEVVRWRAAFQWIDALREGRGYPAEIGLRSFFPELAPPRDPSRKNTVLEVLYTEVAKVKRQGSSWTWHLPKTSYEETVQLVNG